MCAVWKLIYLLKMNNKIVRIKLHQNAFAQHYCEIHNKHGTIFDEHNSEVLTKTKALTHLFLFELMSPYYDQMWSNIEIAESNSALWIVMQVMVELLMIFTICNH